MKSATLRRICRTWNISPKNNAVPRVCTDRWDRRKECLGIGMVIMPVKLIHIGHFDDFAQIHDPYAVGDIVDHAKVM